MDFNQDRSAKEIHALIDNLAEQIPLLHAKQAGAELYGAPRLSVFQISRPDERALSRVVADLFNPSGTHGQGPLFLNALLSLFEMPKVSIREVGRVSCEVSTEDGRFIDVVIRTDRELVGIENKPFSRQSLNQLSDYLAELKRKAGRRYPMLVFLSDQAPETAKGEVRLLRYSRGKDPSLPEMLSSTISSILAPRTRSFVEDFIDYLEIRFGDKRVCEQRRDTFTDAVMAEYEQSATRRKAIADILLASSRVHNKALDELGEFFIKELGQQVGGVFSPCRTKTLSCLRDGVFWGVRKEGWPATCWIGIEAHDSDLKKLIFGVLAPNEFVKDRDIREYGPPCPDRGRLEEHFKDRQGGSKDQWWAWGRTWEDGTPSLDIAAIAEAILHSGSGRLYEAPEMRDLLKELVDLATEIDRFVDRQTGGGP